MKILLLSPNQLDRYNWGHQLFRNDINKYHEVIYYGPGYEGYNDKVPVNNIINKYNDVDLILTYGLRYTMNFGKFDVPSNVKRAHILIDFFPAHPGGYKGSWERYKGFLSDTKFDILLVRQGVQLEYLKQIGCELPAYLFSFSVATDVYRKLNLEKIYDVITSATTRSDVYPNRVKVNRLVKGMGLNAITGRVVHEKYIKAINRSRIAIISTNIFNSPNMKFTEFMSCGTFVLSDRPSDIKHLGFKNGQHLVLYKDMNDLKDKINYFLVNEKEREEIAENGMNFVRTNHSNDVRIGQFTEIIKKEFNI